MHRTLQRKPVGWKQLCAISRSLLEAEPSIDDAEWKEQIKMRLSDLGYTYPAPPLSVRKAMAAVETALEKQGYPRPVPVLPTLPAARAPRQEDPPWRLHDRGQPRWTSIGAFIEALKISIRNSAP